MSDECAASLLLCRHEKSKHTSGKRPPPLPPRARDGNAGDCGLRVVRVGFWVKGNMQEDLTWGVDASLVARRSSCLQSPRLAFAGRKDQHFSTLPHNPRPTPHTTGQDPFTMRDLALRFARAFEGFGLSTSMTSPR